MLAEQLAGNTPKQVKCVGCGRHFTPESADGTLCSSCRKQKDAGQAMMDMLQRLGIAHPDQNANLPPCPLDGYETVSVLGRGGMGQVYKVREISTGKCYAFKTMLPRVAANENMKKLFLREAKCAEFAKHKNVVRTYRTGCANGTFFILMDLCEGGSVDEVIAKRGGRLPLDEATWIILQALSGLEYIHNMDLVVEVKQGFYGGTAEKAVKGIVHRDFKPGNIFLSDASSRPVAMVADMGMAKAFEVAGLSGVSKTGYVRGTPHFMPRQQAMVYKYAKLEVDVWAAAASYYNMLTGNYPKNITRGKDPWEVVVRESAVPIRHRNPAVPDALARVIDRALVDDPAIYYQSVTGFRRDLVAALPNDILNHVAEVIQ